MKSPSVFISYSSKDFEFVNQIVNLLNSVNINCWIDIWGIQTGAVLSSSLIEAIRKNDFILCYLTKNSINSKWVALEIQDALGSKKRESILFFIDDNENRKLLKKSAIGSVYNDIDNIRIPLLNSKYLYPPLMEFVSKSWSIVNRLRYPNIDNSLVLEGANSIGLNRIKYGAFTKEDDEKVRDLIQKSDMIYFLGYNGGSFARQFSEELKSFLNKPNTKIKLLLATPNTDFYDENTYLVSKSFHKDKRDWMEMGNTKVRLRAYLDRSDDPNNKMGKLQIRHFNTQLRNPMIIFDEKICLLTISIPPVESFKSATLEIIKIGASNTLIDKCVDHFKAVWGVSKEIDENRIIQ